MTPSFGKDTTQAKYLSFKLVHVTPTWKRSWGSPQVRSTTQTKVHVVPAHLYPYLISSLVLLVCRQILYVRLQGPISKSMALLLVPCLFTLCSYCFSLSRLRLMKLISHPDYGAFQLLKFMRTVCNTSHCMFQSSWRAHCLFIYSVSY